MFVTPPQSVTLAEAEFRSMEFFFHVPRQGQVEIVSSQKQVLANCDAFELHLLVDEADANQAEV